MVLWEQGEVLDIWAQLLVSGGALKSILEEQRGTFEEKWSIFCAYKTSTVIAGFFAASSPRMISGKLCEEQNQ